MAIENAILDELTRDVHPVLVNPPKTKYKSMAGRVSRGGAQCALQPEPLNPGMGISACACA